MLFNRTKILAISIFSALLFSAVLPAHALAGDCDGTSSADTVTCASNPTSPDAKVGLDLGDDTYVQNAGVDSGPVSGDGGATGGTTTGNGGDDRITINGNINVVIPAAVDLLAGDDVTGNGGNDTLIVNGYVAFAVRGDNVGGNGGDDTIIINGTVTGNVIGDYANGNGGNDIIVINGDVAYVFGDFVSGIGGNDHIEVNGNVTADVDAEDGNDSVVLGPNAVVGSTIDGGAGTDSLTFRALTQAQVNALGLNPASGTTTINSHTYTWVNFESLLGLIAEAEKAGRHIYFRSDTVLAIETDAGDGFAVFAAQGRIAFVSFESLAGLTTGESANYSTPNSQGWHVTVINLGADPHHAGHTSYLVEIFNAVGGLAGEFTFSN